MPVLSLSEISAVRAGILTGILCVTIKITPLLCTGREDL